VKGTARVAEPGRLDVDGAGLEYDELLIATGSVPAMPPVEGLEEVGAWTSREATSASAVPESLVIVGAGAVGCELAQFYARVGSRVTLVQSGDFILPRVDRDAGDLLAVLLAEEGIDIRLNARAQRVERSNGSVKLQLEGQEPLEATNILVATGRKPNVEGLGLEHLDIKVGRGGIEVDDRLAAGEHVWAAGDVTGIALFTHLGKYQGRIAAANVVGEERHAHYRAIPAAIFTDPQVAAVGNTSGDGTVVSKWDVSKVSRTGTFQRPKRPGFVKLFADPERRVLVGAVAVGPEAGEWMGQLTLAIRGEIPVDVLRDTIQPFPTFSEAIFFAARDLDL
jgi:pyruvate/2-oxoglutarate dehydrogenase complex dihydrolipoamide dehydrogenase (E3) component